MENSQKLVSLFSFSLLVFFVMFGAQNIYASSLTVTGVTGSNIIDFRDIGITSDLAPQVSTDKPYRGSSFSGVLTIVDHNANVDLNAVDTTEVNVGDQLISLEETGINTGIFRGPLSSNGEEIIYNAENDVPRAQIDIDLASPGDITISDVILPDTGIGCTAGFEPVLHGLRISLSNGAVLNRINSVTLSYANGILLENDPVNLKMFYQDAPSNSYLMVTELYVDPFNVNAHDFDALTIKTDPDILLIAQGSGSGYEYPGILGEGIYVPALELGCGGGGGGGIAKSGLVIQALGAVGSFGSAIVDAPPTLGLDQNEKRIVSGGFSFNDNPIDVQQYYTPYPLITTQVGQNNTIKLKIFEERGLDNIVHVGVSYGLGKGETFNEGRATIEYDRSFDGVESVTLFDPEHVLGEVSVTTDDVRCNDKDNYKCREFTFNHIFRESLEYNMVATNIWDSQRNGWQNYFNHGIHIEGESLNPPDEYSGIYRGHIYHLIQTGKNTALDDEGNTWTFDKTWNRDYTKTIKENIDILNQKKIGAIEKLGYGYSDGEKIFGFERTDQRFENVKSESQIKALKTMNALCPDCQNKSFKKINNIFSYDLPIRYNTLENPKIIELMAYEDQRAQKYLTEFYEKIYHNVED